MVKILYCIVLYIQILYLKRNRNCVSSCREFNVIGVKSKGRGSKTCERFVTHNSQLVNDLEYGDDMHANYLKFSFFSCNVQGHSDVIIFAIFRFFYFMISPPNRPFLAYLTKKLFPLLFLWTCKFLAKFLANFFNTFFNTGSLRAKSWKTIF